MCSKISYGSGPTGNLRRPALLRMAQDASALTGATAIKRTRLADLADVFAASAAFAARLAADPDATAYEVHEHRPDGVAGDLISGLSVLHPGRVGAEFAMTRGHIHARPDRPEIYACQAGHGLIHMEAPDGTTCPLELRPGDVAYVPPHWIHRSVNLGAADFVTLFCYPADAGQDYGVIAESGGMRTLILADGNGWREAPNPRYRPRDAAAQARLMRRTAA